MFSRTEPNPTPAKHVAYLTSAAILGFLLGVLVHAVAEHVYLQWAIKNDHVIRWYAGCSLHPAIQIGLVVIGIISGLALGKMWWRLVYIERWWAARSTHKNDSGSATPPAPAV